MLDGVMNKTAILSVLIALVVAGCGGGGSSDPALASTSASAQSANAPDQIQSSLLTANFCVAPRSGIDPATSAAYPDVPGTLEQEKNWVRSWIDETYLWFDEIPSTVRAAAYSTTQAFFDALRTPALTASGKPRDQYHFTYPTTVWRELSDHGVESGYGFDLAILKPKVPRDVRVAFTTPGTPAAAAGIGRGAKVTGVDGIDVVNSTSVTELNAALFPKVAGELHSFVLQAPDGSLRTVALQSAKVITVPVQNVKTLDTPTGKVGYLLFNDHVATSESQLISAMTQLKAEGVQDLVLDIRYNGGGLLDIASEVAFMIAKPAATTGTVFERLQFNSKNPFNLSAAQTTTPFYSTSRGLSTRAGQALPQLGLSRLTVLTGPGTCSASESIINSLRGVNVQVTLIGNTTCGKPYGFFPRDNCGTTYFAIQFKGVNHQNFGDYADGIAPTCTVADDFDHALGDPAEARLAAALSYRSTGSCPVSATALAQTSPSAGTGEPLLPGKSPGRIGRFLRQGALSR